MLPVNQRIMSVKTIAYIFSLIVFTIQAGIAQMPKPLPRVFSSDAAILVANKSKLANGSGELAPSYKKLLSEANKNLLFGPVSVMEKNNIPPSGDKHDYMSLAPYHWPDPTKKDGLPYIRKDGETNPEVKEYKDKEYLPQLCDKTYKLALAYYFSGNKNYAAHAAKLLRVWFLDEATRMNPNLNFGQAIKGENTGRGAGLIDMRHLLKVMDGIGLLNGSSEWSSADQQGMVKWFTDFLNWMQTSKIGVSELKAPNNHGMWYDALRLSIALFIDDTKLAKEVFQNAQDRLDKQMDTDGNFPLELQRTTSLHYSVFVLDALFNIAQMGEYVGVDLWNYHSPSGKSIKKGFDAIHPYIAMQKKWPGQQIKEFNFEEGVHLLKCGYRKLNCSYCLLEVNDINPTAYKNAFTNLIY